MRLLDTANDENFLSEVGPGFFSDLDMLEVGNPGNGGPARFPGQVIGQLSHDEQQAHFSLWSAFKSPLVIGADPRSLSEDALRILKNSEVLGVNQDTQATPVRLVSTSPALPGAAAGTAGTKLKMEACKAGDGAAGQRFEVRPAGPHGRIVHGESGQCVTVLAERWPWWVSLLPCNASDARQDWLSRQGKGAAGGRQLIASTAASRVPWPSGGSAGKCASGPCKLEACLEVEGANPEVDQCDWSTQPEQFRWSFGDGSGGSQLRNLLSGQCLAPAAELEVYAGPLAGGRTTAVLLNRSPNAANITAEFSALLGESLAGQTMHVRDILAHRGLGAHTDKIVVEVRPHAVAHLVLSA